MALSMPHIFRCTMPSGSGGPDGTLGDIFGYAFLPDPAEPGQLYVFLDGGNPNGGECKYLLTYYFPLFQMKFL